MNTEGQLTNVPPWGRINTHVRPLFLTTTRKGIVTLSHFILTRPTCPAPSDTYPPLYVNAPTKSKSRFHKNVLKK